MKKYCENPLCQNLAVKEVAVSVDNPSDQKRSFCTVCEEVYAWGAQHGRMNAVLDRLENFLRKGGFVVLAINHEDPNPQAPLEAWAYEGPLDFSKAGPVVFGLGADCRSALDALNTRIPVNSDQSDNSGRRTS